MGMLAILYLQHEWKQEIWVLTIRDFNFFLFFFREADLDKYGSLYFCKPARTEHVSELFLKKVKQTNSLVSSM